VAAVAVVSTPDPKWGERPKAFVELKQGEPVTADEILAFARERLPGYMRPDTVELTVLERTATGKVLKRALRDREWEDRARKVG
jgi:fatty-acyl-CoA synthase